MFTIAFFLIIEPDKILGVDLIVLQKEDAFLQSRYK